MSRLLQGTLELHDVRDVEGLCRSILDRVLHSWGARLQRDDHEDALSYLIATAWRLSQRYEPGRSVSFSTYSSRILERRVVDWYRSAPKFTDTRYRERPIEISLDVLLDDVENGGVLETRDEGHVVTASNVITRLVCTSASSTDTSSAASDAWSAYLNRTAAA